MARPVRIYADEHISRAVVRGLRLRGVDVLTAQETGLLGASDERQLAEAEVQGRVFLTRDHDFLALHAAGAKHAGIIYAAHGKSVGDIIRWAVLVHRIMDAEEMAGRVDYI